MFNQIRLICFALILSLLLAACDLPERGGPFVLTPLPSQPQEATAPPGGKCRLSDLSASLAWNAGGSTVSGAVQLANFDAQPCQLSGIPQIILYNQNDWQLPIEQVGLDAQSDLLILDPASGYTAEAPFVWRNWCVAAPQETLYMEMTLPGYSGKLRLPVQDPNGRPIGGTPGCEDVSQPSTLVVQPFRPNP